MGIKKFFKRAGNWIKDKFHAVKNGVTKFAKVVAPVVKKGIDFIDKTPIAPIINTFTGGLFDKGKKLIDLLPGGTVKDKANEYINKAEQFKDRAVNEIDKRQNQAREFINRGRGAVDMVGGKGSYPTPEQRAQMAERSRQMHDAMAKASAAVMKQFN